MLSSGRERPLRAVRGLGCEPRLTGPEPGVLPLDDRRVGPVRTPRRRARPAVGSACIRFRRTRGQEVFDRFRAAAGASVLEVETVPEADLFHLVDGLLIHATEV